MTERQIHDGFIAWLKKLEVPFIHHRMDRKSGIQTGWPDFSVLWMSRVVCIEVKTMKGRVSLDQARVIAFIKRSGNKVVICRSVEECIEAVKNILCEGKIGDEATPIEQRPRFSKQFAELKETVAIVPGNGSKPSKIVCKDGVIKPCNALTEAFYIANWGGTNYVMARATDDSYRMLRPASASDLINFPALVA